MTLHGVGAAPGPAAVVLTPGEPVSTSFSHVSPKVTVDFVIEQPLKRTQIAEARYWA